jgi:hypothetical protein
MPTFWFTIYKKSTQNMEYFSNICNHTKRPGAAPTSQTRVAAKLAILVPEN